jgi:hypothetical protein
MHIPQTVNVPPDLRLPGNASRRPVEPDPLYEDYTGDLGSIERAKLHTDADSITLNPAEKSDKKLASDREGSRLSAPSSKVYSTQTETTRVAGQREPSLFIATRNADYRQTSEVAGGRP